ncbi:MAG: FAD-binding protein, partial [Chloroflexota bacterium]
TGDGMYLALAAGGEIADMELVQFHPTGMVAPESMLGTLVTEAVRGEGGRLYNANGERYMSRYDAERMELSTRDRVALANYTEITEGRGGPNGGVFLDISHRSKEYILEKLPRMYEQFMDAQNIDISKEPMEVAPTAHYTMGGVVVEPDTHATSIVGLYAAGETTSGLHGANRLGGNSLAETVVFGRRAGEAAAAFADEIDAQVRGRAVVQIAHDDLNRFNHAGSESAVDLLQAVREVMWQYCGVVRTEAKLQRGLDELNALKANLPNVNVGDSMQLAQALDLRASIVSAESTLRGALERRESRGAHQRVDYPDMNEQLNVNFVMRLDENGEQVLSTQNVPPVPEDLRTWLTDEEFEIEGRLLE